MFDQGLRNCAQRKTKSLHNICAALANIWTRVKSFLISQQILSRAHQLQLGLRHAVNLFGADLLQFGLRLDDAE